MPSDRLVDVVQFEEALCPIMQQVLQLGGQASSEVIDKGEHPPLVQLAIQRAKSLRWCSNQLFDQVAARG
jgi:hypothetical protein